MLVCALAWPFIPALTRNMHGMSSSKDGAPGARAGKEGSQIQFFFGPDLGQESTAWFGASSGSGRLKKTLLQACQRSDSKSWCESAQSRFAVVFSLAAGRFQRQG